MNKDQTSSQQQNPGVDLRAVKAKAKEKLAGLPGIEGVGIGDCCIRVYVRDEKVAKLIPDTIQGVRLEPVISGSITALA